MKIIRHILKVTRTLDHFADNREYATCDINLFTLRKLCWRRKSDGNPRCLEGSTLYQKWICSRPLSLQLNPPSKTADTIDVSASKYQNEHVRYIMWKNSVLLLRCVRWAYKHTLFLRVSCLSSSLCSSSFSCSSALLSKLKDTELAFFLPLIAEPVSNEPVIFVGAIVIGGTQSEDNTISASEYTFFDGIGGTIGIGGFGSRISIPESWHDNLTRDPSSSSGMAFDFAGSACCNYSHVDFVHLF